MTNPKGLHFYGGLWQGCRFAPTPALPKDQALGLAVRVWALLVGLFRSLSQLIADDLRDQPYGVAACGGLWQG